ncbi:MAG: O-antigen polymerase [Ramlibacter sp.]
MSTDELLALYALMVVVVTAWSRRCSGGTVWNPVALHTCSFAGQLLLYLAVAYGATEGELHFALLAEPRNVLVNYLICSLAFMAAWIGWREKTPYLNLNSRGSGPAEMRSANLVVQVEMLLTGLVVLAVIAVIGFPLLDMIRGRLNIQQMNAMLVELPFGLLGVNLWLGILLALNLAVMWFFRRQHRHSPRRLLVLLAVIVFSSIFYAKRQLLVMALFFVLMLIWSDKGRPALGWRQVALGSMAFLAFLSVYLLVQFVRIGNTGEFEPFELLGSALWPLINFDRMADATESLGHLNGLLSQIIPNRWFGHAVEDIKDVLFEPTASVSYVQYAYHDLGSAGVAGAAFVLGLLTRLASGIYRGSVTGLQIRLLVLWVCATAPFYSHGFSNNYFLVPVIMLMGLQLTLGRVRQAAWMVRPGFR